jgi:hypothetical protein
MGSRPLKAHLACQFSTPQPIQVNFLAGPISQLQTNATVSQLYQYLGIRIIRVDHLEEESLLELLESLREIEGLLDLFWRIPWRRVVLFLAFQVFVPLRGSNSATRHVPRRSSSHSGR